MIGDNLAKVRVSDLAECGVIWLHGLTSNRQPANYAAANSPSPTLPGSTTNDDEIR